MSSRTEAFAKLLIQHVRDEAIRNCDALLTPRALSPIAKRWQQLGSDDAIRSVIPDVVDEAMFALLHAIDDGVLTLQFVDASGHRVDLGDEGMGELGGWYMGMWREEHAKERFVDYLGEPKQ